MKFMFKDNHKLEGFFQSKLRERNSNSNIISELNLKFVIAAL